MDIKTTIVRDYLESLKESQELDYIFPLFLESQGFIILSKPTKEISLGLTQYGKDVIAIGNDFFDGKKKRFYFELKGGDDRNINDSVYSKKDGIRDSLIGAKDKVYECINKEYNDLPLKIIIVHNGDIKSTTEEILKGFISQNFSKDENITFDRWGISELTLLFTERFFGEFLLADRPATKLFNKTLVNLDSDDSISKSYTQLIDLLLQSIKKEEYKKSIPRKWKMLFESLRLICFIIYTESKNEYNNLEIAKKYLTYLVIKLWYWILKNKFENDKKILKFFDKIFDFYFYTLTEYFQRTLPIAFLKDGLYSEEGGKYEQIGYTFRTFDYLQYLTWYLNLSKQNYIFTKSIKNILIPIINNNSVSNRALLDIHSIPIIEILNIFIEIGDKTSAKNYLELVLSSIITNKEKYGRLPDANNSKTNVIKFIVTSEKPIHYSDSTSLLLATLMEYIAILDLEDIYIFTRDFINKNKITLGIFIPHHGIDSKSKHLIEDNDSDLEEQLFSKSFFNDGYQDDLRLYKNLNDELDFDNFKKMVLSKKDDFKYEYRTVNAGYPFLLDLAHIHFKTPFFPDKWRKNIS